MYKISDISVVIATFNRTSDLKETLSSLKDIKKLNELIIVDQSNNKETEKLVKSLKSKKIKYVYSKIPSLTKARNIGVSKVSKKSKLICFVDDDVTFSKNYFQEILNVFNKYPAAKGVSAFVQPQKVAVKKFENFIKSLFFIEHLENEKVRVISSYGNTYSYRLTGIINSHWLSGVNMIYKKEIFKNQRFDENLKGYALAEDFDFSYRINKRYPNSLFITPFTKIIHRVSTAERYPTEKISYMNQAHHFYLNFKNFNKTAKEKLIFAWSLIGISLLRSLYFLKTRKNIDALKLKFFFKSLFYCLANLRKIRKGKFD